MILLEYLFISLQLQPMNQRFLLQQVDLQFLPQPEQQQQQKEQVEWLERLSSIFI